MQTATPCTTVVHSKYHALLRNKNDTHSIISFTYDFSDRLFVAIFPKYFSSGILKILQVDLNHDKNEQILSSGELRRVTVEVAKKRTGRTCFINC